MAWTLQDVAAAVAALDPPPDTDETAAGLLNGCTRLGPGNLPCIEAKRFFVLGREWQAVARLARQDADGPAGSAAVCFVEYLTRLDALPADGDPNWGRFDGMMADLVAAGAISAASRAAIADMRPVSVIPVWLPPVRAADVAAARAL